ncbi:unnamed protein product [Lasius platythorax]|uniref:DUF4371 domain-containing protein n=1 Tax=Lasius platythorax TaxID=488582 RepID=A0AAV2N0D8_9HYME
MIEKCDAHQNSFNHQKSTESWDSFKIAEKRGSVAEQVVSHKVTVTAEHREYVKYLAKIALFCARQNMGLRGHDESDDSPNRGNFLELLELIATLSSEFARVREKIPNSAQYTSPPYQNALLEAAAKVARETLVKEVKRSGNFSIISDGTTDIRLTEQMTLCLRFVDAAGVIQERYFDIIDIHKYDARSITTAILSMLERHGLDKTKCVAQCYDTTNVMSGESGGVQNFMREECGNSCPYIHCYAHRLQLVLSHTIKDVPVASNFLDLVSSTVKHIRSSKIRHDLYVDVQVETTNMKVLELPKVCVHKWEYNHKAISILLQRLGCVLHVLQNSSRQSNTIEERAVASGLLTLWRSFSSILCLVIFDDLFSMTSVLSKLLQSKRTDLCEAINLTKSLIKKLDERRSDDSYFTAVYQRALTIATEHNLETDPPRQQKRKRTDSVLLKDSYVCSTIGRGAFSAQSELHKNLEKDDASDFQKYFRVDVFNVVYDRFITELSSRLLVNSQLFTAIAACNPKSPSFLNAEKLSILGEKFDIDCSTLTAEIVVVEGYLKSKSEINTLTDALKELKKLEDGLICLCRLFTLAATIPIANASCERSFSVLKLVKITPVPQCPKRDWVI